MGESCVRRSWSAVRFVLIVSAAVLALPALAGPPLPAGRPGTSQIVDAGEEEQIEKRQEWFLSSRLDGLTRPGEMAERRRAALTVQADELRRQRLARGRGTLGPQNFWTTVGPAASHFGGWAFGDVSGRITGIAKDSAGNVYIASAAGGVWKTANDGLSWTNVFENAGTQPTGAVAVDPNDDSVVWVGTGDFVTGCEGYFGIGLLRSTDGGATWAPRNGSAPTSLDDMSNFSSVLVDPRDSNHLVVGGVTRGCTSGSQQNGGLYTSNDGGLTWTKRIPDIPIHEIQQDPVTRNTWWAGTAQGVWKSTDNAATWTKVTASSLPSSGTGRTEIAVSPIDGNYVYALFESDGGSAGFWRTTNGGASWTKMSSGNNACDGQCWYDMTIAVSRINPNTVYRGTILIFKSTDGGANWTALTNGWGGSQQVHQDTHVIVLDPASTTDKFYVGCDGGLWKSPDGGATFVNMNTGLDLFLFYAIEHQEGNPDVVCGGAQDNSSLVRTASNTWDLQAVTGDGFVCGINPQNPNIAYITSYPSGGYPSVSRSTTGVLGSFGGITGAGSGIQGGDRINWVTPYTLDPNNGSTLLLGTHRVYRSTDTGTSWEQVGPPDMTNGGQLNVVEFNRTYSNVAYAGSGDGKVFRSTDNGRTWTDITANLAAGSVNDLAGDPEDPDRALVAMGGFNRPHVYEWTVSSGAWTPIGSGLPNVPANTVLPKSGAEIFVGTDVGVYASTDRGVTFTPYMDGLPTGLVVTDLRFNRPANVITAGTYGRGAYQVSVAPPQPNLIFDSIALPLVEVDGDHDGSVEPGETWEVTPLLRNAGGVTANSVSARLATATPGVRLLTTAARDFGSIAGGAKAAATAGFRFTVDPSFTCGGTIVFDVVGILSSNAPGAYRDQRNAFTITVVNNYLPNVTTTLLDQTFDPSPPAGWTHEAIAVSQSVCFGIARKDEWRYLSKDAAHGTSAHCGLGPGKSYSLYDNAWLYYGGKDSIDGPGLVIPADAVAAQLTLVHWYKTQSGADGGIVVVDATDDNLDNYVPLVPNGGYPGSLATGFCNAQEGRSAFTGNSGGWVSHTFNLTKYAGQRIWLAFVFGSDKRTSADEGWYVDEVKVETQTRGAAVCQVTPWAGVVPPTATFARAAGGDIAAQWSPACNAASTPGQAYAIEAGSLGALAASGSYGHQPVGGLCNRTSPATFTPGAGNEYYLVVANVGGREGSAGNASNGTPRPQTSTLCGTLHEPACP